MKKISLILLCIVLISCLFGCHINQGANPKSSVSSEAQSIEETSENNSEDMDKGSKDSDTDLQKKDDGNKNSSSNDGWGTDFPF